MNWVDLFPLIFFPFKIIVLLVGMFFSIKWHYDQDKKKQVEEARLKQAQTNTETPQPEFEPDEAPCKC